MQAVYLWFFSGAAVPSALRADLRTSVPHIKEMTCRAESPDAECSGTGDMTLVRSSYFRVLGTDVTLRQELGVRSTASDGSMRDNMGYPFPAEDLMHFFGRMQNICTAGISLSESTATSHDAQLALTVMLRGHGLLTCALAVAELPGPSGKQLASEVERTTQLWLDCDLAQLTRTGHALSVAMTCTSESDGMGATFLAPRGKPAHAERYAPLPAHMLCRPAFANAEDAGTERLRMVRVVKRLQRAGATHLPVAYMFKMPDCACVKQNIIAGEPLTHDATAAAASELPALYSDLGGWALAELPQELQGLLVETREVLEQARSKHLYWLVDKRGETYRRALLTFKTSTLASPSIALAAIAHM